MKFSIGLDFGTNSVRALIVDAATGQEISNAVWEYAHGEAGIILDPKDPNLARQHPRDYVVGIEKTVTEAIAQAKANPEFSIDKIIGIGVDATGSTPMPINANGDPVAFAPEFDENPNAMAWLWKDHTSYAEASEITEKAAEMRPEYLAKCGGTYSSEWFWSKMLHCKNVDAKVHEATHTWVEIADWLPALLCGTTKPDVMKRGICAAGHKGMFNPNWGGYPDAEFVEGVDKDLLRIQKTLPKDIYTIADQAGQLTDDWASKLGLPAGLPVAVGMIDAHSGAVGSGIGPGVMVKIMGTSTCDMMVARLEDDIPDVPGLCGIVPESILPGAFGFEAGQAAVGDIFNWFVNYIKAGSHEELTAEAERLSPGESGLLSLDWHNGNRTVLVDQRLTGLLVGMTLHTKPAEIYRALVEATAFGARVIMERFEEYGVKVNRIVNCGGISVKNPMVMQIYADVTGRPLEISSSAQTCALGAAMAGAVVAGKNAGGHEDFAEAAEKMTGVLEKRFIPIPENVAIYERLNRLYMKMHDAFGTAEYSENLADVMKELLEIRDEARN